MGCLPKKLQGLGAFVGLKIFVSNHPLLCNKSATKFFAWNKKIVWPGVLKVCGEQLDYL